MQTKKLVRVSSKGQIVIPKGYRDRMGIREGDYVLVKDSPEGVLLLGGETWLGELTKELRADVEAMGFTREDLDLLIHEIRKSREAA